MLRVSDLTVEYGQLAALRHLSVRVDDGKLTAVVGANGSGKSTLLKTIMGWVIPSSGAIEFDGVRLDGSPPHDRARKGLAYVPEGRRLFPDLTVLENLELGCYALGSKGSRKAMLREIFDKFEILEKRKNQHAGTLSGGEQQMLAIARALMSAPRLLMLDEPSLGLSPIACSNVFGIVQQLRDEGVTCLFVEQNAAQALRMADIAFILQQGTVVAEGAGRALLENGSARSAYLGA
jgi:branched-chain amino acid transport system ATP-binding protein